MDNEILVVFSFHIAVAMTKGLLHEIVDYFRRFVLAILLYHKLFVPVHHMSSMESSLKI